MKQLICRASIVSRITGNGLRAWFGVAVVLASAVLAAPASDAASNRLRARRALGQFLYRQRLPPLRVDRNGIPLRFTPPEGGGQPLYPAEPLLEPSYGGGGGGGYPAPLSLPGNIIVEVPAYGRAPPRLDKIRDVGPYLTACWHPPYGLAGFRQLTLRMGFRRSGVLMGPPRLTYSAPAQTAAGQRTFVAASTAAFVRCTPLPLTTGFGRAIAGVPFAIRFTAR